MAWRAAREPEWAVAERAAFADHAGDGPRLVYPWLTLDDGVRSGRSRLGNLRAIPAGLHALTLRCQAPEQPPRDCGRCLPCLARAFYATHCASLSDAELAAVEARIEELAQFGAYFATADPETYHHRHIDAVLADEYGWLNWFEEEGSAGG